jgi:hypothetical protein
LNILIHCLCRKDTSHFIMVLPVGETGSRWAKKFNILIPIKTHLRQHRCTVLGKHYYRNILPVTHVLYFSIPYHKGETLPALTVQLL